jgi:uncharacterized protein YkwD
LPRRVRLPFATTCALLAALAGLAALAVAARAGVRRGHLARHPASCAGADLEPTASDLAAVENATLCLVNRIREAHGLARLRSNASLAHAAARKVARMLHLDYFADADPAHLTPLSLVVATPYPARAHAVSVGQNIAWGTGADATPANVVATWMRSAPHRAIILTHRFRDAGVGARPAVPSVLSSAGGATYAMEFGARTR